MSLTHYKKVDGLKDTKVLLYAPTFRDSFWGGIMDMSVYDIDFEGLCNTLKNTTGHNCVVMVKFHPFLIQQNVIKNYNNKNVINATAYQNMQSLLLASDAFISDYSSCIFDVALRKIPCFTFAVDFDEYKRDRGVYFEMSQLPFPYSRNNDELNYNIKYYNKNDYLCRWNKFKEQTGLYETGHASEDVANLINNYLKN